MLQTIKRLFPILSLFLLFVLPAHAQCIGSGSSWACPTSVTTVQLLSAIASASDGAVFTFAAGTYNNLTSQGKFSPSKGATFICASASNAVGASTVAPCVINAGGAAIFGSDLFSGTVTKFYRISGFTFDLGGASPPTGTIYWSSFNGAGQVATLTQIRVDHNTFRNGATGAQTTLIGDTQALISVHGVYDHNLYTNATQFSMVIWLGLLTPTSTFPTVQLGTANNLFLEDNTLSFTAIGNASAEGCTDGWGGSAYVVRHNTATNCLWAAHGETHAGGPANYEFYNNTHIMTDATGGFGDCTEMLHHQGSGTAMFFNNRCTPVSGHTTDAIQIQHYRGGAGTGGNSWAVTGVTISGTTATYQATGLPSGCGTAPDCSPHGWYNISGFGIAGNNTFTQITSSTATTLVGTTLRSLQTQVTESHAGTANFSSQDGGAPQCDGTVAPPSTLVWSLDGNRSPTSTYHGYPCFNQPGRDFQGNIQPYYAANNLFTDNLAILPMKVAGVGGIIDLFAFHMQSQREWFDEVGNTAQTTSSTPFNGTTGTGWGTLALRPTSCNTNATENAFGAGSSGVGYYATDVGSQGTWYKCVGTSNPGTWTAFYTPYPYPHPLVTGGNPQAGTPACTPGTGSYSGTQPVSCTNPSSAPEECYTLNGTTPVTNGPSGPVGCAVGTLVSGSISVTPTGGAGTVLLVVAGGTGFSDSAPASNTYTLSGTSTPPNTRNAIWLTGTVQPSGQVNLSGQ
jgi:hypothetical protein